MPADTVWERHSPLEAWYEIHGLRSTEPVRSFLFDGFLDYDEREQVVYQRDNTCFSDGNYEFRNFYFNLTNSDGDSLREWTDFDRCWKTDTFPDGYYWVVVTARDAVGNEALDSMQVKLVNGNTAGFSEEFSSCNGSFEILNPLSVWGSTMCVICREEGVLQIFDASGREIIHQYLRPSHDSQNIDVTLLPAGVYFIHHDSNPLLMKKFIIIR